MKNEIIIFNSNELAHHIEVRVDEENETFCLTFLTLPFLQNEQMHKNGRQSSVLNILPQKVR